MSAAGSCFRQFSFLVCGSLNLSAEENGVMPVTCLAEELNVRQSGFNLFLVGFLILFLELACIRWFSATVIFVPFFTNIVLIASFLGMSCGCLAARQRRSWLAWFPLLALGTFAAARLI